jgi:hypothetical protein
MYLQPEGTDIPVKVKQINQDNLGLVSYIRMDGDLGAALSAVA